MHEIKIRINQEETLISEGLTLTQLIALRGLKTVGLAIGVNQVVIKKTQWDTHVLQANDDVLLIQATCGG